MSMKLKWFKRVLCSCFIMLALLAASSASEGAIFRVTPGGAGNKSGDSWANAMSEVEFRKALEDKTPGEYWVAEGEYTPHDSNPDKSFVLKKNIALYGGFAGDETQLDERDWEANVTILSGAIGGGLRSKCVVLAKDAGATAILDGFTITAGKASAAGGGMLIENGSPTVTNCTFSGNVANNRGGGMYILKGSPTLTNCTFSGNEDKWYGGGMFIEDGSPTLTNCTFSENKANDGGGMLILLGNPTLTNCTFSGNVASGVSYGGGMSIIKSSPTLTNCTFSGNKANECGGGMYIENSSPTLTNCTFSENEANQYGGGMAIRYSSNPTVTNTIFWGAGSAAEQVFVESGSTLTITYSVVDTDVFPGEGNTKADPKLGPLASNGGPTWTCALLEGSSAIDSGTDTGAPSTDQRGVSRPQGLGYDIGAYEKEEAPVPPKPGSSGGGGCAAGPFSPWVLALLAPLAPIALRKRPGRRGR